MQAQKYVGSKIWVMKNVAVKMCICEIMQSGKYAGPKIGGQKNMWSQKYAVAKICGQEICGQKICSAVADSAQRRIGLRMAGCGTE